MKTIKELYDSKIINEEVWNQITSNKLEPLIELMLGCVPMTIDEIDIAHALKDNYIYGYIDCFLEDVNKDIDKIVVNKIKDVEPKKILLVFELPERVTISEFENIYKKIESMFKKDVEIIQSYNVYTGTNICVSAIICGE